MKNITIIFAVRNNIDKFRKTMKTLEKMTANPEQLEMIIAIDNDDEIFMPIYKHLENKFARYSLKFNVVEPGEHMTRTHLNTSARLAQGRFIATLAGDCEILTYGWDEILFTKMSNRAKEVGDDILNGLVKDDIHRKGEDPLYPHFSCYPVISKEHINVLGYFFDERYWTWGSDQAVTIVYKKLNELIGEQRLVSLTEIEIVSGGSIHSTDETDEIILEAMRKADKGYQRNLRISQEHGYTMTPEDTLTEARKLADYINNKQKGV